VVLNDAFKRFFDALTRFFYVKWWFNEIFGVKQYLKEIFLLKQYSNEMKSLKVHLQPFSLVNIIHFLGWNGEGLARTVQTQTEQDKWSNRTKWNLKGTNFWVSLNRTERRRSCPKGTKLKRNETKGMLNETRCQQSDFAKNFSLDHACCVCLCQVFAKSRNLECHKIWCHFEGKDKLRLDWHKKLQLLYSECRGATLYLTILFIEVIKITFTIYKADFILKLEQLEVEIIEMV
jgi:hypothetical protein